MEQLDNTKQNIMNIAVRLFSERGYDAIGVQEICNESKITKPTLYYYFGSKTGLLKTVIETKGNEFIEQLKVAAEYKHDFPLSLTLILKSVIAFAKKESDFFRLQQVLVNSPENSEAKNEYLEIEKQIQKIYEKFFKLSANEFGNMRGKEKLYAALFCNNVNSVGMMVLSNQIKPTEDTISKIIHSFMYGVAN